MRSSVVRRTDRTGVAARADPAATRVHRRLWPDSERVNDRSGDSARPAAGYRSLHGTTGHDRYERATPPPHEQALLSADGRRLMLDDISVESVVEDGGSTGRGRITMLRLAWRRDDPLAVALLLTAEPDHPALPRGRWVVLRDFLRYGLEEPTGDGDVRLTTGRLRSADGDRTRPLRATRVGVDPGGHRPPLPRCDRGDRANRRGAFRGSVGRAYRTAAAVLAGHTDRGASG